MNNNKSGKNSEQSAEKMLLGGTLSVPHRRRSRSEVTKMNNDKSGKNSEQSAEKMLLGGTLSVPRRRRSRSEYVFCEMNSPPTQMDGNFEGTDFFSAQMPTDAEWIQQKDQSKTSDDVRKASTSCVGRTITYGNTMKAMEPRTKDVAQHLLVTDDIGKVEIPEETQDNEVSTKDVIELVLEKYPNILDIRVPLQQSQFPNTQLPEVQAITKEIDGNLSYSEHIDKGVADTGNQMRSGLHWVDEDIKMVTDIKPLEDQMGRDNGKASCQEITCGDLLKELQKDPISQEYVKLQENSISQDKVCYGTAKSLEELAKKHTEFETGFHGVFTDMRFEILKTEPQKLLDFHTTPPRKGSFGEIRKCQFSADLVFVSKRVTRNFRMEEAIFTNQHDNPYIVKSFALLLKDGIPEIIMEYAGQSLLDLLNEVKSLPETTIRALTFQLCSGLVFLESRFIIHCDIKPENIFVMPKESGNYDLKIGDFGSAQSSKAPLEVTPCTPEYMAPEMFHFLRGKLCYAETITGNILQPKTDVFSAGLVVGFMYGGENLLIKYIKAVNPEIKDVTSLRQHLKDTSHVFKVFLHADIVDNLIPEAASLKQRTIMHGMLQIDVAKRHFAKETLNVMIAQEKHEIKAKRNLEANHFNWVQSERETDPPGSQASYITRSRRNVCSEGESDTPESQSSYFTRNRCSQSEGGSVTGLQIYKVASKIDEIMAEPKQLRKRITKRLLKRKIQHQPVETAPKIRRTSEASQDSPDISQGGISKENWEGCNETSISLEHQFPKVCVSEYQYPICQAEDSSIPESQPGNLPALDWLGM